MEIEKDEMLPFLGSHLLNRVPQIETKVYVKPTSTVLLLHYHSHIDNRSVQTKLINNYAWSRVPFVLILGLFLGGV